MQTLGVASYSELNRRAASEGSPRAVPAIWRAVPRQAARNEGEGSFKSRCLAHARARVRLGAWGRFQIALPGSLTRTPHARAN